MIFPIEIINRIAELSEYSVTLSIKAASTATHKYINAVTRADASSMRAMYYYSADKMTKHYRRNSIRKCTHCGDNATHIDDHSSVVCVTHAGSSVIKSMWQCEVCRLAIHNSIQCACSRCSIRWCTHCVEEICKKDSMTDKYNQSGQFICPQCDRLDIFKCYLCSSFTNLYRCKYCLSISCPSCIPDPDHYHYWRNHTCVRCVDRKQPLQVRIDDLVFYDIEPNRFRRRHVWWHLGDMHMEIESTEGGIMIEITRGNSVLFLNEVIYERGIICNIISPDQYRVVPVPSDFEGRRLDAIDKSAWNLMILFYQVYNKLG